MRKAYYKLTKQDLTSFDGCQWELGVKKTTSGEGELCSSGWLHCYKAPLLAVLLNSIHADFRNPRIFEVEVGGEELHDGMLKSGFSEMTLMKEIELPIVTLTQRVAFGILCALKVSKDENFIKWAQNWLNETDRTKEAAYAAYAIACTAKATTATMVAVAAWAAAEAAEVAIWEAKAVEAAKVAAETAEGVTVGGMAEAKAVWAATAATAAKTAAEAAAKTAIRAAEAAEAAVNKNNHLDLITIAKEAMGY